MKLSAKIVLILSVVLIVVGLKFCSIESGPSKMQNDGFNVTGGFMTMIGGIGIGMTRKRGKQHAK